MGKSKRIWRFIKERPKRFVLLGALILVVVAATLSNNDWRGQELYVDTFQPPPETPSHQATPPPGEEAANSQAYYLGVQAGEIFIESRDAFAAFLQGFNYTTGAGEWASDTWSSVVDRFNEWNANRQNDE